MSDEPKPTDQAIDQRATAARAEDEPRESDIARGNVVSKQHDEPELPTPPPLPH